MPPDERDHIMFALLVALTLLAFFAIQVGIAIWKS